MNTLCDLRFLPVTETPKRVRIPPHKHITGDRHLQKCVLNSAPTSLLSETFEECFLHGDVFVR